MNIGFKKYQLELQYYCDIVDGMIDIIIPHIYKFKDKIEADLFFSHYNFNIIVTEKGIIGIDQNFLIYSKPFLIKDYVISLLKPEKAATMGKPLSLDEIKELKIKLGEDEFFKYITSEQYTTTDNDYYIVDISAEEIFKKAKNYNLKTNAKIKLNDDKIYEGYIFDTSSYSFKQLYN